MAVSAPMCPKPLRNNWIAMTPPKVEITDPLTDQCGATGDGRDIEVRKGAVIGVYRPAGGIKHDG